MEYLKAFYDPIKQWADGAAFATLVATFFKWVPEISGAVGLIWLGYRIYEAHLNTKLLKKQLEK